MQTVTKIINVIKGGQKFLSHRKFQNFLGKYNAIYTDVPLYYEIRWHREMFRKILYNKKSFSFFAKSGSC